MEKRKIEIMDTTLRDGEQTSGVSFSAAEKLTIAQLLLEELNIDRIEIASARVSEGEFQAVKGITSWAEEKGYINRIEVLTFVDGGVSIDWMKKAGAKVQFAFLRDVVEVAQRVLVDLQEMRDARHAAQALGHVLQGFGVGQAGFQLEVVPHTIHHHSRVQIAEHGTDVLGQLTDETHPYRSALDGDLGEDFND